MNEPDPATLFLGRRVREIRHARTLSQAALSDRLRELGSPLGRTAVVHLETGKRETVTVQEMLALAQALDVPPTALLADMSCSTCWGAPPTGFSCNACGASTDALADDPSSTTSHI
jgi:transcriptional regulator with XRE-family HTH domain